MSSSSEWPASDDGLVFLDTPQNSGIATLVDYWRDKAAGRAMPDRADINLVDLGPIAPHLLITEPVDGGADFRLRLFGSELVRMMGEERTGMLLSEIERKSSRVVIRDRWLGVTRQAYETGKPLLLRVPSSVPGQEHRIYHTATLPMTHGSQGVGQLLGAFFLEYRGSGEQA